MDKGIRPECNKKFGELLPTRENTRAGNTAFRKTVMAHIMTEFGITLASAATHYNHAFIDAREKAKTDATLAGLLEGLGRPEDKKGGRKPKAKPVEATPAADTAVTGSEVLESTLLSEGVKDNTSTHTVTVNPAAEAAAVGLEEILAKQEAKGDLALISDAINPPAIEAPVQKYSVRKAGDKSVVCSDLTLDEANALIEKAAKAKKAKLELVA